MQFILFVLSFALNPLIIGYLPSEYTKEFLMYSSAANLIFSLGFTLLFGWEKTARKASFWIPILAIVILILSVFFGKKTLWFYYTFVLLAADYSVTQTQSRNSSLYYRIYLIISALSLLLFKSFFYEFIILRSIGCSLFVIYIISTQKDFYPLAVKSPLKMIVMTFTFYSGSLTLLPHLFDSKNLINLKLWFVGSQIGLGLTLKELDYLIRGNSTQNKLISNFLKIGSLLLPFLIFSASLYVDEKVSLFTYLGSFIIYYISLYGLYQVMPMIKEKDTFKK